MHQHADHHHCWVCSRAPWWFLQRVEGPDFCSFPWQTCNLENYVEIFLLTPKHDIICCLDFLIANARVIIWSSDSNGALAAEAN